MKNQMKNQMKNTIISLILILTAASVAPTAVYFEEQKAIQNINAEKKITDWDFGTASFYTNICQERKLKSQTCEDANRALNDYKHHRSNVEILGY
jgi:hypothetical protein